MSIGTAFHLRTSPLNRKQQWREWSGYFAASAYADGVDIEYNAVREAAALIDVSPLFKYLITGPDATAFVDRVQVRNASRLAVGQVHYTCWCDEDGKVVDDGTINRLAEHTYRWTAADPQLRWFRMNARGLDVQIDEVTERTAALALQGPRARAVLESAAGASFGDLKYFRGRPASIGPVSLDVTRTGYTGDLGYELWVDAEDAVTVWDAVMDAGQDHAIRPVGMLALDIARIEAGLILLEVDYTSSRHALIPEQNYSPFEIGLGRLVALDRGAFIGRRALLAERRAGGPARRLVGLMLDWNALERLYLDEDLPPMLSPTASRSHVPLFSGRTQVGRVTSTTWSPTLKNAIALASVRADHAEPGTTLQAEWTVEAKRHTVPATVVELPFFNPPRKTAVAG
jgi:aminomethyltransferase